MKNKIHIIFMITFSPKFGYIDGNTSLDRAIHVWYNDKGEKIGVWREDWAYQLGNKMLDNYSDIIWEVWRPDIRADKVYSHAFDNGLITKSFPVMAIRLWSGVRKSKFIYSPKMINYLNEYIKGKPQDIDYLLVLPASRNAFDIKFREHLSGKIAMHYNHFLYSEALLGKFKFNINPIRLVHDNIKAWQQKQYIKSIKSLVVVHKAFIHAIRNKYNCEVSHNTMGADLDYWKPTKSKEDAKKELSIQHYGHIFLFSSRLTPEYQIHKVLKVIKQLKDEKFHCFFTSQGPQKYGDRLKSLIIKYNIEDKVTFTGYVDEAKLKLLYTAADTFFMTSVFNAGPLSTFYAMLLKTQVITTDAGLAAEILKENNCGLIVSPKNYNEWFEAMLYVIKEKKINLINPEILEELLDWNVRTKKWYEIFSSAIKLTQTV